MEKEEKFNEIYETIVNENAHNMEIARGEAKVENRQNAFVLIIIILINAVLNYVIYKLIGGAIGQYGSFLLVISVLIYSKIRFRDGKSKIIKYKKDFKTNIVGKMVKSFEEQLEFTTYPRNIFNDI